MSYGIIATVLLTLLGLEVPNLHADVHSARRDGVVQLAAINHEVAKPGKLVSHEVDELLLATIQFYEARLDPHPPDGDCRPNGRYAKVCSVQGPMQLMKGANAFLPAYDPSWKGVTSKDLRDPRTNVDAAYTVLAQRKTDCGGPPGVWITAYGQGKCPTWTWRDGKRVRKIDWEGRRRCALLTALLEQTGRKPDGWLCGHEGKPVLRHTRWLVRKLRATTPPVQ